MVIQYVRCFYSNEKHNLSAATNIQQKLCLVTVSSKEYWAGTKVAISSFLNHNKWFVGDIKIITSDARLRHKKTSFPRTEFLWSDSKLNKKLDCLCDALPELNSYRSRLLVLNIFRLSSYTRVIYIDSDLLFLQSLEEHITQAEFMAAPDPWLVRGFYRTRIGFEKIERNEADESKCYTSFFNSGLLSIGKSYLNDKIYSDLLNLLTPEFYREVKDDIADEPVLNFYFEKYLKMLPETFNSSVHILVEQAQQERQVGIHFTGKNKPWVFKSWLSLLKRSRLYLPYLINWIANRY